MKTFLKNWNYSGNNAQLHKLLDDEDNTEMLKLLDDEDNDQAEDNAMVLDTKLLSDDDIPLANCTEPSKTKKSSLIATEQKPKPKRKRGEKTLIAEEHKPKRKRGEKKTSVIPEEHKPKRKRATRAKRTDSEVKASIKNQCMSEAKEEGTKLEEATLLDKININASESFKEVSKEEKVGPDAVTKKETKKMKGWKGWAIVEEEEECGTNLEDVNLVKDSSSQDTMGNRKRRKSNRNKVKMA
ncbi:hypothetical protein DFH28DRAFT_1104024 [Melampsora americana]|nr:hypothetical protein DFH28DRAFT_1104024 [Melampsora americana]